MNDIKRLAAEMARMERERKYRSQQNNVDYGINRKIPARADRNKPDYKTKPYETFYDLMEQTARKLGW